MTWTHWFPRLLLPALLAGVSGCSHRGEIPKGLLQIEDAAARVIAEQVNQDIEAGGTVLFLHNLGGDEVSPIWQKSLRDTLDSRFQVAVFGRSDMSEEAARDVTGLRGLQEGLAQAPDAVALILAVPFPDRMGRDLLSSLPPVYALGWMFLENAAPYIEGGAIRAGLFERPHTSLDTGGRSSPEELADLRYLFVTGENLNEQLRQARGIP